MYLYLFHLFESVVSHSAQLVKKTVDLTMSQIQIPPEQQKYSKAQKETLNTLLTDKSDMV